ncbi:MAG TPA: hypothetical protein VGM23_12645 [Armatimonadota bacterium]|jgi:hypothetical protein
MINPLPAISPVPSPPRHACRGAIAILCGGFLAGVLAGMVFLYTRPPQYRASALLLFPAGVQTASAQVQSRELVEKLVRDLDLTARWKTKSNGETLARLQRELHGTVADDTLLRITVTDPSAQVAGTIAQAAVDSLNGASPAADVDRGKSRLQNDDKRLNEARKALATYQLQNPLTLLTDPAAIVENYRGQLDTALRQAKPDAEAKLRDAKKLEDDAKQLRVASQHLSGPNPLAYELQRVIEAEKNLALLQALSPISNDEIETYRNDVESAKKQFDTELQRQILQIKDRSGLSYLQTIEEALLARVRVQGLQQILEQVNKQVASLVAQQARCKQLTAEVATLAKARNQSFVAFEQASALAELCQSPYQLVDAPGDPAVPLPRYPLDVLALFTAAGLCCSIMITFFRWRAFRHRGGMTLSQ